jgi:hypothetical protein
MRLTTHTSACGARTRTVAAMDGMHGLDKRVRLVRRVAVVGHFCARWRRHEEATQRERGGGGGEGSCTDGREWEGRTAKADGEGDRALDGRDWVARARALDAEQQAARRHGVAREWMGGGDPRAQVERQRRAVRFRGARVVIGRLYQTPG